MTMSFRLIFTLHKRTLYIYGPACSGKTQLAKYLAALFLKDPGDAILQTSANVVSSSSMFGEQCDGVFTLKKSNDNLTAFQNIPFTSLSNAGAQLAIKPKCVVILDEYDKYYKLKTDEINRGITDLSQLIIDQKCVNLNAAIFIIISNETPEDLHYNVSKTTVRANKWDRPSEIYTKGHPAGFLDRVVLVEMKRVDIKGLQVILQRKMQETIKRVLDPSVKVELDESALAKLSEIFEVPDKIVEVPKDQPSEKDTTNAPPAAGPNGPGNPPGSVMDGTRNTQELHKAEETYVQQRNVMRLVPVTSALATLANSCYRAHREYNTQNWRVVADTEGTFSAVPDNDSSQSTIRFRKPEAWRQPYIYVYVYKVCKDDSVKEHAKWPGTEMQECEGLYIFTVPEELAKSQLRIMFNNGFDSDQIPEKDEPGFALEAFSNGVYDQSTSEEDTCTWVTKLRFLDTLPESQPKPDVSSFTKLRRRFITKDKENKIINYWRSLIDTWLPEQAEGCPSESWPPFEPVIHPRIDDID
jgi:hypothetical protein